MKRLALICALVFSTGCASLGGSRHVATVTVTTSHGVLMLLDATEEKLVCGVSGAPSAPACVDAANHRAISAKMAQGFDLDAQVARTVKAMPVGAPTPAELIALTGQITTIVNDVMALIPNSSGKTSLSAQLDGGN